MTGPGSAFKSRGGLSRLLGATRYSLQGLRAAFAHEAAFRQELAVGLPLIVLALWLGRGPLATGLLVASILFVFVVELLNSAIEALADAQSTERHPMLGRAKDLGSAAVMLSILAAVVVWAAVLLG